MSAVISKVVVLLLLIHCLLFVRSMFCYAILCFLSSFAIISLRKRELVALL